MFIESAFMVIAIKDAIVSADMTSCVMLTFDLSTRQATKITARVFVNDSDGCDD